MLDPLLTNVLRRRVGAFAIDLGGVAAVMVLVALNRAEKFVPEFVNRSNEPIWSTSDQARRDEIVDTWHRMQGVGDNEYVWTSGSVRTILLAAFLSSALVFFLIPAIMQSTLGQKIFGLRISDLEGKPASLVQHLVRSVAGLVDLAPYVIPGLLGWFMASRTSERQRIGDRFAGTTVVDAKGTVRMMSQSALDQRIVPDKDLEQLDDSMVNLDNRLGTEQQDSGQPNPDVIPQASEFETHFPEVANLPLSADQPGASEIPTSADFPVTTDAVGADTGIPPLGSSIPSPVETPSSGTVTPETAPVMDSEMVASLAIDPPYESKAVAKIDPGTLNDSVTKTDSVTQVAEDRLGAEAVLPPPPLHRSSSWESPQAEPAPVWSPSKEPELADSIPDTTTLDTTTLDTTTPETTTPDTSQATEDIAVPSTVPPDPANPDVVNNATIKPAENPTVVETSRPSSQETEPIWNDDWQAWIYWDDVSSAWLRHDIESDIWIPLS